MLHVFKRPYCLHSIRFNVDHFNLGDDMVGASHVADKPEHHSPAEHLKMMQKGEMEKPSSQRTKSPSRLSELYCLSLSP